MVEGGLERVVVEPRRLAGEPVLAGAGLLLINPAELRVAGELARAAGWRRWRLFHCDLWLDEVNGCWLAGPAVGAPMAVLCLEKLIVLGGGPVISLGWCGGLAPELAVGDILLPTWALSEEGTSGHYPLSVASHPAQARGNCSAAPAPGLLAELRAALSEQGLASHQGGVWTTDAPYRETVAKVEQYRERGVMGVEMEYAALATVAAFRGLDFASLLLVSDLVRTDAAWQPAFDRRDFRRRARMIVTLLMQFIGSKKRRS